MLQSITLNTAKILGIDNILGSIESGKNATFFISSGDALDMRTNNINGGSTQYFICKQNSIFKTNSSSINKIINFSRKLSKL